MLINPPSRVQWVRRDGSRRRLKKRIRSERIVHVKIRPNDRHSSMKESIVLKNRRRYSGGRSSFSKTPVQSDRKRFDNVSVIPAKKNSNRDVRTEQKEEDILMNIDSLSLPKSSSSPIDQSEPKKKFR